MRGPEGTTEACLGAFWAFDARGDRKLARQLWGAAVELGIATDAWLEEHWGKRGKKTGGRNPKYGRGYWAHYPLTLQDETPAPKNCNPDPKNAARCDDFRAHRTASTEIPMIPSIHLV